MADEMRRRKFGGESGVGVWEGYGRGGVGEVLIGFLGMVVCTAFMAFLGFEEAFDGRGSFAEDMRVGLSLSRIYAVI
jgi:hypothetical protein